MLELLDIGIDNAVAFRIDGKITQEELSLVHSDAKSKIETHGDIVIYEEIVDIKGIELAAIADQFKYLFDVGTSNIRKISIVTDKKWLHSIAKIEDKILPKIDMKCFTIEEKELAVEFLKNA